MLQRRRSSTTLRASLSSELKPVQAADAPGSALAVTLVACHCIERIDVKQPVSSDVLDSGNPG